MLSLAVFMVSVLFGCGPRDAAYDPSQFKIEGAIAPRDVAVPSSIGAESELYDGLYTGEASLVSCCWIAPQATLLVRKPRPANTLVAGFWVPNIPRMRQGQTVTIDFPGTGAPSRQQWLEPNDRSAILLAVPPRLRDATGLIPVRITSAIDYVPSRDAVPAFSLRGLLHMQKPVTDARPLAVILLYLYFDNRAKRS